MEHIDIAKIVEAHYKHEFSGIHPAAEIFPFPTSEDYCRLRDDIEAHGLNEPLVRHRETRQLLDGRTRLLACYELSVELKIIDSDTASPTDLSVSLNMSRRHMSASDKAFAANRILKSYEVEAKERQGARNDLNIPEKVPERSKPMSAADKAFAATKLINSFAYEEKERGRHQAESRIKAAAAVGANDNYVTKAKNITTHAPHLEHEVTSGKLSIGEANRQALKVKRAEAVQEKPAPAAPEKPKAQIITVSGEIALINKPAKPVFNATNDSVSWAAWTWNPVTGCNHGCKFCYAREISHSQRMSQVYPFKFKPAFHDYRLAAPKNTKLKKTGNPIDGRVFVCSMADLFGKWVPDKWITSVFDACMSAPEWEYLFLTKWPKRYKMLQDLPHAWFGASIIQQADVARVERDMKAFQTSGIKWVSLEPMLEPIVFNDISWCDLMVIGAQTTTHQPDGVGTVPELPVPIDWVVDVINQCRAAGVPYYLKPNLSAEPGMVMPTPDPRTI